MSTQLTGVFAEISSLQSVFAEAKKLRRARHPAHVLVVEDDPLTRRIVESSLGESNAMLMEGNGDGAIASYLLHAPDVVFLDIGLPDIDGFTVLDYILTLDPDAFIVMFSSHNDRETIRKAQAAGAKGFVAKPFKKETLSSFIQGSETHHHKSWM